MIERLQSGEACGERRPRPYFFQKAHRAVHERDRASVPPRAAARCEAYAPPLAGERDAGRKPYGPAADDDNIAVLHVHPVTAFPSPLSHRHGS